MKKSYNIIIKKSIQFLIKDYRKYFKSLKNNNFKIFKVISKKKQLPKTTVVNCCDSKTNAEKIFNSLQEELFVYRNVASLSLLENKEDTICANSKAREYLTEGLNVPKIIILVHCNCVSLKSYSDDHLVRKNRKTRLVYKNNWLQTLKPYFHNKIKGLESTFKHLAKKTLIESVKNIKRHLFIETKVYKGQLTTLGCWFDINIEELLYINEGNQEFSKLKNI